MDKKQFKMVAEQPEVTFNVTFMPEETDVYQGALSVTPTKEAQKLETAGFTFLKNLTIEGIPDNYVDTSSDTVTAETLAEGATAHDANGNAVVGVAKIPDRDYKADLVNLIQGGAVDTLPDGITKIGDSAFYSHKNISITEVPEGVTEIGQYAFYNSGVSGDLRLPDSLEKIGYSAFSSCNSLRSVNIPKNVTEIDAAAFTNCWNLKGIYVEAITPPKLGGYLVTVSRDTKIYVPQGTIDAYKAANNWSMHANKIVEADE